MNLENKPFNMRHMCAFSFIFLSWDGGLRRIKPFNIFSIIFHLFSVAVVVSLFGSCFIIHGHGTIIVFNVRIYWASMISKKIIV